MNPTPNVEKSTSFKKYYRCDASTVNKLCQTNNLWGVGKRDYPKARQYLADEFGLDLSPFQEVIEPYAHCDQVINIFTQLDGSRQAEQARVRLAFAPFVLKEDGIFYYLKPDHFPVCGGVDYHFQVTCSLVFDGKLADGYQRGVVGSKLLANLGKTNDEEVCRQTAAWSEVLTDLRSLQTDRKDPPVFFAYDNDGHYHQRDMIGERLYLTLSPRLDLPWMINNSRVLLEQLAEDPNFQKLVRMKRAILDAKDMRSASTRTKVRPLTDLSELVTSYSGLFTGESFAEAVISKTTVIQTAVNSLHDALDAQIQAAEVECTQDTLKFSKKEDQTLTTFLQHV